MQDYVFSLAQELCISTSYCIACIHESICALSRTQFVNVFFHLCISCKVMLCFLLKSFAFLFFFCIACTFACKNFKSPPLGIRMLLTSIDEPKGSVANLWGKSKHLDGKLCVILLGKLFYDTVRVKILKVSQWEA